MRKKMPYMVLDITKKPGDPNAVQTGDMLLAENTKLREAISTLRTALKEIRDDVLDMVMNHKSEDLDSYAHGLCLSIGGACDMALNSTKEFKEEGGAK